MVVLNTGLAIVWKHHVRRESMDRAVSDPSREVESQDNPSPPDIPLANLFSVDVPSPSQAPSDSPANLRGEMGSGQRQALKEVPAVAVEMVPPVVTQSSEATSYPLR